MGLLSWGLSSLFLGLITGALTVLRVTSLESLSLSFILVRHRLVRKRVCRLIPTCCCDSSFIRSF